jgi:2,3-diaminopropionate biosynthesis protein SbnB
MKCEPPARSSLSDPHDRALTILGAPEVAAQLQGRERELMALARDVLLAHGRGDACAPAIEPLHTLRSPAERWIASVGCVEGPTAVAGLRWTGSFPGNAAFGLPRSSGLIVLNDPATGRPTAVVEGSLIGSQRTAASAALAARVLHGRPRIGTLGLFGCGLIGREILRFLLADDRPVDAILLYDRHSAYSRALANALRASGFAGTVSVSHSRKQTVASSDVLVLAASATRPTLDSIERSPEGATILHVSLRDVTAHAVLQADNIADDIAGVLQGQTSAQRAMQLSGSREIFRTTLAQVIEGQAPARLGDRPVMFHPAGLATLDLAIAQFVCNACARAGSGLVAPGFLV